MSNQTGKKWSSFSPNNLKILELIIPVQQMLNPFRNYKNTK